MNMKKISLILSAAICLAASSAKAADSLTMADFNHSIKLQVDGYTGSETLVNFPVLVRVSESGIPGFHFADMSATNRYGKALGYDLAFFAENGDRLACDQDTWDIDKTVGTTGEQLVWVKLPSMTQGTKFYMCYNVANGVYVTNDIPWSETAYVGVWHMREASGTVTNATGNGLDAVPSGTAAATASVAVSGPVGNGRQCSTALDASNLSYLSVPSYDGRSPSVGNTFTVSGWFSIGSGQTGAGIDARLFSRKNNWEDKNGWEVIWKTSKTLNVRGASNSNNISAGNLDYAGKGWKHICVVYNGRNSILYENGIQKGTKTGGTAATENGNPLAIGGYANDNGSQLVGSVDECRLLDAIPSPDWVKAEYETVANASFVTVAPVEVLDVTWAEGAGISGVTNVTWNSAVIGGAVTELGADLTCIVKGKFWLAGDSEPAEWTTLSATLSQLGDFSVSSPVLIEGTNYNYKLCVVDSSDTVTNQVSGSFTTPLGLAVSWSESSGNVGVTNVAASTIAVGGTVQGLGSSATCAVEGKFWLDGTSEPSEWTTLVANISQTGDFSATIPNLTENSLYRYTLRVKGSNGLATEAVGGTFSTEQGLSVSWPEVDGRSGVTNIAWNAVVVGGIVSTFGDSTSCDVQYKLWTGDTPPENWTTLVGGISAAGGFSAIISNLTENTTYSYKLRAIGSDGSTTVEVSGTFTTPTGLAASWPMVSGCTGVTNVMSRFAVVGGTILCLGDSASCTVKGKFWTGNTPPESWTNLVDGVSQTGDFSVEVADLEANTTYHYALCVTGSNGATTETVSGSFTTVSGLVITWSNASGTEGMSRISYDFAVVGGTVTALGDATSCDIYGKFWPTGAGEPESWMTLKAGLGLNDNFQAVATNLTAGTTYNYALRALGNEGSKNTRSGTFTTRGEPGETIGTSETHFFMDGTNAYWVANDFERYLDFTVTGYKGTETLTNFPVLVEVRKKDTNGFTYDDFYRFNGEDIAFVDEKGRVIPHEIDTWNPNGQTLIWVRLPEMNQGTTFTMCYRSPLIDPPTDPGNVFEKYVGVWHMNEKEDGIVDVIDSTTNNLVGETHANSLAYSSGRVGGARRVAQHAGTSSTYGNIVIYDHDDILRTGVGNTFTYSCWSKLADNAPSWAYLVSRKREDADKGWGVQYHDNNSTKQIRIWGGSTAKNEYMPLNISNYAHQAWAYWTFVFDNTNCTAYLDGVEQEKVVIRGVGSGSGTKTVYPVANDATADFEHLVIGGQQIGTGALNGWVDECRYSKGIRSADWIRAEYDSSNQQQFWNDPARRFVTKGTQVGRGKESLVPVVVWETGARMPETVIDVSYAYVQFAGTVTFCGSGTNECRVEYQLWADGEVPPGKEDWTILIDHATVGTKISTPVFGLKQDMPYNYRIRAANDIPYWDEEQHTWRKQTTREITGSFRTYGNVNESAADGDLYRVDNRFVHMYRAGEYLFTTPDYVTNIAIMVVGGGGAGGYKIGGGGGGGGVFYSQSYAVTTSTTYRITVGRGGIAPSNTTTVSSAGNGEYSSFALDSDASNPLIEVPGGGGGGSCSTTDNIVNGYEGASGGGAGGKGDTSKTGATGGLATQNGAYGNKGGDGNHKPTSGSGSPGTYAAGGGGGGSRAGLAASSDSYYGGGAGGSGLACDVLGETLYYGAGGGGGYKYKEDASGFSKPGAGGSGIGGNAADVKNGTLATSGIENTGAGGGGGSMTASNNDSTYWQGGDGGDGVVIIAYEVHGRDPVADEPRISMTSCTYEKDEGLANIAYRVYWAGMQNDLSDILIHYSTVSSNELDNVDAGNWLKVAESRVGTGSAVFVPPEVGHTYWLRLVARKDANSYSHSEEIACFTVPAVELNGVTWKEDKDSSSNDYATVSYKLFETNEVTHLYCYWSESRAALEGDGTPSGDNVYLLDLGANTGTNLSSKTAFNLPATEGLVRNRTYYLRLASGDAQGLKHFLSAEIVELDTKENPSTVLNSATWADSNVATVEFRATVGKLDPAGVELVALYGVVESDVKDKKPETNETVSVVSLGLCSELSLDETSLTAMFPLWSEVATNYYVRLALATNVVVTVDGVVTTNRGIIAGSYSAATRSMDVFHAIEANTLLYIVTANPKVLCYGDTPLPLDYMLEYAGQTEGWGWDNKYAIDDTTAIACYESTNPIPVAISSTSPSGNYAITRGTLQLVDGGQGKTHRDETTGIESHYQYKLTFSGATYTITNAVFSTTIADASNTYSAVAFDTNELVRTLSGVRNEQPVTYFYRVGGAGEWSEELPEFVDVGNYNVQFKASAPNHDDVRGSFKVTVAPAPLSATISTPDINYTGDPQVPVIATNVAGLVRGDINLLTCEFRDESGEWMSEVPSFTQPGTYKLYFRVSAPNHATFVTNCTFTIAGWDYPVDMDGKSNDREGALQLKVSNPGWLLRNSGITGVQFSDPTDRYGYLNEVKPNGLKLWQNYVIGQTNMAKKLVATIMQREAHVQENQFLVHFPNIEPLRNTGLAVKYRLDRKLKGESEFTLGEISDKYEMGVSLSPGDPTGLYRFNIVLLPTNGLGEAVLDSDRAVLSSVATIGVMRVSSVMTNTVIATPWRSMSSDIETNVDVSVSDVVNPNGLSGEDEIWAYNKENGKFNTWKNNVKDGVWDEVLTVTKSGVSSSDANDTKFPLGKAFWLVRSDPSEYIYLVGRYTGEDYVMALEGGTTNAPGHTLVANPTFNDVDLNSLVFVDGEGTAATPAADDRIIVMNIAGLQTIYYRNKANTQWGRNVTQTVNGRRKQVWSVGGTIPAGTGFWYNRTAEGSLNIKFESVK